MGKKEQYNVQNQNMQNQMMQNQNMYNQNMQNQMMQNQNMYNQNMQNQNMQYQNVQNEDMQYGNDYKQVDWEDGKIHTVVQGYDINDPEHWNRNVHYRPQHDMDGPQYIKGRQAGFTMVTNDPRVTIPVCIIACMILIIITIILLSIEPIRIMGIFWAVFTVVFIVGILKQNIPKWKQLLKALEDDKDKK